MDWSYTKKTELRCLKLCVVCLFTPVSHSPGGSESSAGKIELSGLKRDEERTLGGELFTPVGQRSTCKG